MYEYLMESDWAGWFGGYGAESVKCERLNRRGQEGWRLVRSESKLFLWMCFLPRVKLLYVWERPKAS
jgi:hypothetical protein